MTQLDLGSVLRDRGIALVDAAEPAPWKDRADAAIRELASSGAEFSAEDVRAIAGNPDRPNAMGARFNAAVKSGILVYVRHSPSNRAQLHRCKVAVWRGVTK